MAQTKPRRWPRGVPRREDSNFNRQLASKRGNGHIAGSLPLVHTTACWSAEEIVKNGKLTPSFCEVFSSSLLYFFVLRPAYRSKYGAEPSHQISRFPVAFVLRCDSVEPRHAYPFDTGGAARGAFEKQADKFVPLEDYALNPSYSDVVDFITWAFGDLERYFEGRLRSDISQHVKPFESVAVSYVDIARMGIEGSNQHDKRASTVEIATSQSIDTLGNVILMIMPKQLLEGNSDLIGYVDKLKNEGMSVRLYDWQPNRSPDEFQRDLMEISHAWYQKKGFLP